MTTDIEYIQRLWRGVFLEVKPWPNQGICLAVTLRSAKMKAGELVISVASINLCVPCMCVFRADHLVLDNPLVCSFLQKTTSPSQHSWVPFSSLSRVEALWAFPLLYNIFRQEICCVSDLSASASQVLAWKGMPHHIQMCFILEAEKQLQPVFVSGCWREGGSCESKVLGKQEV